MRTAFLAVILVACGHPSAETKHPVTAGTGSNAPALKVTPPPPMNPGAGGAIAAVVIKDLGCPAPTCVYHAGGAAYFNCLAGGAGMCFHFGPTVGPDSQLRALSTPCPLKVCVVRRRGVSLP